MHGLAVTTVEGIGSTKTRLHPVQERLAKSHGSQCGFCTPGIVMSMYTLLRNNPQPSVDEMEKAFDGNLCRCTGYRPILEGFKTFTKEFQCPMGDQCCQKMKTPKDSTDNGDSVQEQNQDLTTANTFTPYDASQELIFPSELQINDVYDKKDLVYKSARVTWYRPTTLDQLLKLKSENPDAKIVTGNTEVGIEVKFKNMLYPIIIAPTSIPEMTECSKTDSGLCFGGAVTLTEMEKFMKKFIEKLPAHRTKVFVAVVEMLRWFAGHQVRNVAAIAGNIMTASPISDLNPIWLAAGCNITVMSKDGGQRNIPMDDAFFQGYRQTVVKPEEVLLNITVPYTKQDEYFHSYKQAHRRDDDIAIVNAAMRVMFEPGTDVVKELSLAYGGMAPTTVMAKTTMKSLIGKHWNEDLMTASCQLLADDLPLSPGVPGGSESYRQTLTTSFFFKFYLTVLQQLEANKKDLPGQPESDPIGRPIVHKSALEQTTGEARYCDDTPKYEGELYLSPVLSTVSRGKIVEVDPSLALQQPGVVDYISHRDVPGSNITGPFADEEVFASEKVESQGYIIGAVLADDQQLARRAANMVKIRYEELEPIITIEQAIEANSFIPPSYKLENGDIEAGFKTSDHTIEGEVRIGGQEHFYLETQACIAIPKGEHGEMDIISGTQSPSDTQNMVAAALGVPNNRVVCHTKRIGGGFGGKESRSIIIAMAVAIAANKHNIPVRCMLDRDEDMVMTGTRHPFLARYKVGFTNEGNVMALTLDLYCNCGCSTDLSPSIMARAILHSDNCYRIPNVKLNGYMCRTNLASNTAFRGFGAPQGQFVCETWMTQIAKYLNINPEKVRELNLYTKGDKTPFMQDIEDNSVRYCWDEVKENSKYEKRKETIEEFNRNNRWKKRGLAMTTGKHGIAFGYHVLNQAGALVHVYTDGSVLLSHGGIEMGQGLYTKMIQVASRALSIPHEFIHTMETATNTVPNTSSTAASVGSDINGMAVLNACKVINERLEPYKKSNPEGEWKDWVNAAYTDRVGLSSTGFYKLVVTKYPLHLVSSGGLVVKHPALGANGRRIPDIGYDWKTNSGNPYHYFTFGVACSEVEIDCLTGDHTVLRTDIVMDVGKSLNPTIDIGQIEGAFVQGYGLFTLEEQRYSPNGFLYTRGPGSYKIPSFSDIPVEFNVSLLKGSSNPKAVYSSKAIGEPPLFLSSSVFFAIHDAISAARHDAGYDNYFTLHSPATAERIRMACVDQFTKQSNYMTCNIPFNIICDPEFRNMIKMLRPGYKPPTRHVTDGDLLDSVLSKIIEHMKTHLDGGDVTVVRDGWSGINNIPVIAGSDKSYFISTIDTGTNCVVSRNMILLCLRHRDTMLHVPRQNL
ncbi:hypothetical protein LSH36_1140g00006 [Paralvinella palmiformis]|uniref:xanthine dehydrogenase n=1 Tax=Paralvinella palmiformis TaxID=53620 RepID=A0AAD9MRJ1_9ANNE|nr:hypothetical protein LSH36_1140g00006 [Paralvinella palmiformis]